MKIKILFVCFFKCSFIKRVGSVIFELDKVYISNYVKFRFQQIILKIEQVFEEKKKNILSQKLVKRAMNLLTKKGHKKCKISYMWKKYIFL